MKKTLKIITVLILLLAVFPGGAALAVRELWNVIVTTVCGFAAITFWQAVGLFLLSQILTGGFLLAIFLVGGSIHALGHHHAGELKAHWFNMTDEQRRQFIERRRREHFRFRNRTKSGEDAAE